ncbi:integrase [Paracoccus sp. IB05]|uniref:integrase n=1 Tax=Paracoccus sp. IB05 TaxID=2779367 RepID=UPI00351BEF9C
MREAIGAEKYDIHGLRYAAAAELAVAGCSDELIASITGYKTSAMVAKYAGPARQKAREKAAQIKRGTEQE